MLQQVDDEKKNQGEVGYYNPLELNNTEQYPQGYELEFGTLSLKKSKKALENLRDSVINTYFTSTQQHFQGYTTEVILDEENGEYVLALTLQLDTYYNQYIVYSQYKFKPSINQIESYTYLTDLDGSPTRIQEKPLRLLVGRYFFRLNDSFRLGSFSIHPFLGYIKFKMSCATATSNFNELIQNTKRAWYQVTTFIREIYQTSHYSNNFHLYKTLYLANKMNESIFEEIKTRLNPSNFRSLPPQIQECEKELEEIVTISSLKEWKPKQIKGQGKIIKYKNFFIRPKQVPIVGMDTKIHSPIDIRTKYAEFYSQKQHNDNFKRKGGFSDIYSTEIEYAHKVEGVEKLETRRLIAKLEREDGTTKIQREKDIITHLAKSKSGECPYIVKFYLPIQKEYKGVIFMEYYDYKSLEHFKQHQSQILTLNTKLYILYQLALGIKFLKDANVIHSDLEPGNILVSKNMMVKIIDFGGAIIRRQKQINPGYTMPYSPPEIFDTNRKLNQRSDIFSFGMIAYEFFFDVLPVDFRKHAIPNLVEEYKSRKFILKSNKKDIENQGPKKIIGLIRAMFLLCLSPNSKQRPYIEWVIVFTRLALKYLDNLY